MRAFYPFGFFAVLLILSAIGSSARADELTMPYQCTIERGAPRLSPADLTVYHIYGPREDMPFSACGPSPGGACEMMMVHKFTIDCGSQRVSWAKVAAAARSLGVDIPEHLPPGYAPISRLSGRFVLPGFGRTTRLATRVSTQTLSPDSVTEVRETGSIPEPVPAHWVTVVDSEAAPVPSGEGLKVASVVSTLLASLLAACLLVARRRPLMSFNFASLPHGASGLAGRVSTLLNHALSRTAAAFRHSYDSWQAAVDEEGGDAALEHALDHVHGRLRETELLVSSLPPDLLLRDVLESELDNVRQRGAEVARRGHRLGAERAAATLRALMRDLDRITRIVHGALNREEQQTETAASAVPSSVFEAYRVLGLNPEAPSAAVKKVVDALRMSWHPDHARDEADRLYREQRIKQINAAWDLLKGVAVA